MITDERHVSTLDIHPLVKQAGLETAYPFRQNHFLTDSGRMHFVDEGKGPVLLFVHGNPTWSFSWRNLIKRFSSSFRCIAIDHVGCGLSEKPQADVYRLADHVQRLKLLVENLELRDVTLIAHDWGGAIGTGVAGSMPDRFSRLVLMNTAAFRSQRIPFRIAMCRWPVMGTWGVRGANLFVEAALRMAVEETTLSRSARKGYRLPYSNWKNRIAVDRFVKDIPLHESHPSYQTLVEIEKGLSKLSEKPILLPWGMKDWCFTPHFLEEFQRRFPRAKAKQFEQAGHYLFEDRPEELAEVIGEFLARESGDLE